MAGVPSHVPPRGSVAAVSPAPIRVEQSVVIAAPPALVWSAVSDPTAYGRWSPEATGARVRGRGRDAGPLRVGDVFTGRNRVWLPWATRCEVVAVDEERRFAYDASMAGLPIARWSFELQPRPDGATGVTQVWEDHRTGARGAVMRPAGLVVGRGLDASRRNEATMRETLRRLKNDLERRPRPAS